jgi:hypothetical protein
MASLLIVVAQGHRSSLAIEKRKKASLKLIASTDARLLDSYRDLGPDPETRLARLAEVYFANTRDRSANTTNPNDQAICIGGQGEMRSRPLHIFPFRRRSCL